VIVNGYEIKKYADLKLANLSGAKLSGADLKLAKLSGADISEADLSWANLSGAKLSGAKLSGANLSGADLSEADLSWANLSGADLSWVYGIEIFSAGEFSRLCFTYTYQGEQRYQLGCFNGNFDETVEAIRKKYGENSRYEAIVTVYKKE